MYGAPSHRYPLRSHGPPPPSSDRPGYQPPRPTTAQPYLAPHATASAASSSLHPPPHSSNLLDTVTATLEALTPMIDSLQPKSAFEIGMTNIVRLIVGQQRELKLEHHMLHQSTERSFCEVDGSVVGLTRAVVKSEQYTRRDTVTMVGLEKPKDETDVSLSNKVAETLSASGVTVSSADFSVVHRNGKDSREIRGKTVPPSVTVKFAVTSKKDIVLKSYKNFDPVARKPRNVKVFQSLSPHYGQLRRSITDFFNNSNNTQYNHGKELKWVTYQSPTSGLCVKLKTDEYFKDIHIVDDFYLKFGEVCRKPE